MLKEVLSIQEEEIKTELLLKNHLQYILSNKCRNLPNNKVELIETMFHPSEEDLETMLNPVALLKDTQDHL